MKQQFFKGLKQALHSEPGAFAPLVALMLTTLLIVCGLAMDSANLYLRKLQFQHAIELGAIDGMYQIHQHDGNFTRDAIDATVLANLEANKIEFANVEQLATHVIGSTVDVNTSEVQTTVSGEGIIEGSGERMAINFNPNKNKSGKLMRTVREYSGKYYAFFDPYKSGPDQEIKVKFSRAGNNFAESLGRVLEPSIQIRGRLRTNLMFMPIVGFDKASNVAAAVRGLPVIPGAEKERFVDVVVVVDRSGSMQKASGTPSCKDYVNWESPNVPERCWKITELKAVLKDFIVRLGQAADIDTRIRLSIISYSSPTSTGNPSVNLDYSVHTPFFGSSAVNTAVSSVNAMTPYGGTTISAGLAYAISEFEEADALDAAANITTREKILVLLTDGFANQTFFMAGIGDLGSTNTFGPNGPLSFTTYFDQIGTYLQENWDCTNARGGWGTLKGSGLCWGNIVTPYGCNERDSGGKVKFTPFPSIVVTSSESRQGRREAVAMANLLRNRHGTNLKIYTIGFGALYDYNENFLRYIANDPSTFDGARDSRNDYDEVCRPPAGRMPNKCDYDIGNAEKIMDEEDVYGSKRAYLFRQSEAINIPPWFYTQPAPAPREDCMDLRKKSGLYPDAMETRCIGVSRLGDVDYQPGEFLPASDGNQLAEAFNKISIEVKRKIPRLSK